MALTLAKFNATKKVPGAWPQNPVTSPTLLMMIVSIVNCLVDSANLLVQCCGAAALGVMAGIVSKVHKVTGSSHGSRPRGRCRLQRHLYYDLE